MPRYPNTPLGKTKPVGAKKKRPLASHVHARTKEHGPVPMTCSKNTKTKKKRY